MPPDSDGPYLDHQQVQFPQSAHYGGNIIQCCMLFHVEFLREQFRNLNRVLNLLAAFPDETRCFVELMNPVEFSVQQQQFMLNSACDKVVAPFH